MHGCCADELLVQTILGRFEGKEPKKKMITFKLPDILIGIEALLMFLLLKI